MSTRLTTVYVKYEMKCIVSHFCTLCPCSKFVCVVAGALLVRAAGSLPAIHTCH